MNTTVEVMVEFVLQIDFSLILNFLNLGRK